MCVRLALKVVMQFDGDFVDVHLSHESYFKKLTLDSDGTVTTVKFLDVACEIIGHVTPWLVGRLAVSMRSGSECIKKQTSISDRV